MKLEPLNITDVKRAPESRNLPVVFTRDEANAIIAHLKGENRLIVSLLYGSGLRIMEAVRLRVKDLDFERREITVRDGKGEKDRVTMLPHSIAAALHVQVEAVKQLHEQDLKRGSGEVYLPYALESEIFQIVIFQRCRSAITHRVDPARRVASRRPGSQLLLPGRLRLSDLCS